jgi:hypothetical protein
MPSGATIDSSFELLQEVKIDAKQIAKNKVIIFFMLKEIIKC